MNPIIQRMMMAGGNTPPSWQYINSATYISGSDPTTAFPSGTQVGDIVIAICATSSLLYFFNADQLAFDYYDIYDEYGVSTYSVGLYAINTAADPATSRQAITEADIYYEHFTFVTLRPIGFQPNINTTTFISVAKLPEQASMPDPPSITTAVGGSIIMSLGAILGSATVTAAPTGFTNLTTNTCSMWTYSGSTPSTLVTAITTQNSPGAIDPSAFAGSMSGMSHSYTLAIRCQ